MNLEKPVVYAALETLAEICGKILTEKTKELFLRRLQYGQLNELRIACEYFSARGHFPTLNELLNQMGLSQVASREQVEAAKAREAEALRKDQPQNQHRLPEDYECGFWTFMHEIPGAAGREAKAEVIWKDFEKYLADKGWLILDKKYFSGKRETVEGNRTGVEWMYKAMVNCYREKPRLQILEEKKQWPTQSL